MRWMILLLLPTLAAAEEPVVPRDLGCVDHAALTPEMIPPELARVVRACVDAGRHENALRVWLSFNSYALYDQQRVRDTSAHMVLQDLYSWTFAGYTRTTMAALKEVSLALRDREGAAFRATCAQIVANGAPSYRPTYMIQRGVFIPLKDAEDWAEPEFDPEAAWRRAVSEVNGCPAF